MICTFPYYYGRLKGTTRPTGRLEMHTFQYINFDGKNQLGDLDLYLSMILRK